MRGERDQYAAGHIAQAERVSWRIIKDWVEAQIALVESSQAEMAQVFMPYATDESGGTLYMRFLESNQKRLASGSDAR